MGREKGFYASIPSHAIHPPLLGVFLSVNNPNQKEKFVFSRILSYNRDVVIVDDNKDLDSASKQRADGLDDSI